MNAEDEIEMQYRRLDEDKERALDGVIRKVKGVRNVVDNTGTELVEQGKRMERVNERMEHVERKAERTNNKMANYLNRTSNCKLYVALAIEVFIFILLMSI